MTYEQRVSNSIQNGHKEEQHVVTNNTNNNHSPADQQDNANADCFYEEQLELKLEKKIVHEEQVLEVTLPAKIEISEDESSEEETSDDETTDSSEEDLQPEIVEVTDLKECEGLATVEEFTVDEVEDEEEEQEQEELEKDEEVIEQQVEPDVSTETIDQYEEVIEKGDSFEKDEEFKDKIDIVGQDETETCPGEEVKSKEDEVNDQEEEVNDQEEEAIEENEEVIVDTNEDNAENLEEEYDESIEEIDQVQQVQDKTESEVIEENQNDHEEIDNENLQVQEIQSISEESKKNDILDINQDIPDGSNKAEEATEVNAKEDIKQQLLRSMPTPKIPPFVKSEPPCDFREDPTTWIEWLESEVLKFKQKQKEEQQKAEEMAKVQEVHDDNEQKDIEEILETEEEVVDEMEVVKDGSEQDAIEDEAVEQDTVEDEVVEQAEDEVIEQAEDDLIESAVMNEVIEEKEVEKESANDEVIEENNEDNLEDMKTDLQADEEQHEKECVKEVNDKNDEEEEEEKLDTLEAEADFPRKKQQRVVRSSERESDPMEVIEKMRQMRQNRVLQRHMSADGAQATVQPPPFMRVHSNPDASRNRSRPSSIANEDSLDDMLGRVRKLREERQQILKDMAMLKDAFNEQESNENADNIVERDRLSSFDSGIGKSTEGSQTRKVSHQSSENYTDSDTFYCFICDEDLGSKLTKGAIMHMGLEDGEPICPEALHLTEKSKQKIKNIALTKHLDLKDKYDFLETLDLDLITSEDYDPEDVLQKVESFLDHMEEQKKKDQEQFDLLMTGAIEEIYAAEFANNNESIMTASYTSDEAIFSHEENEPETLAFEAVIPQPPAPPPAPAPPVVANDHHLKEARSELLNSIRSGAKLKPAATDDKSQVTEAGKVLHKHLAPRVFTKGIRDLMHEIQTSDVKSKLKKTKTNDRSKPYIPQDIEIYFYAGPNADHKSLAPPPKSREIPSKRSPSPQLLR